MPKVGGSRSSGGGESRERVLLHPGPYLLALVFSQRKTGKSSGKRYLNCRFEVVGGRAKGVSFFDMISLDLNLPSTAKRWEMLSDACGVEEEFELGSWDEGNEREGDDNIRRLFRHVPFGAEVSQERDGQYINNRISRFIFRKAWRPEWAEWADQYLAAHPKQERPEDYQRGDPASNSPEDVGYPPDDGFGDSDEPGPPPPAADYSVDDDDIPF